MDKSEASHAILDQESRERKANKIYAALEKKIADFEECKILDIGTGAGYIAHYLGKRNNQVTSIDVVDERREKSNYKFKTVKDEKLPFKDSFFDIVISNHVVEHVPDQEAHINEIHRVLKKGGIMYLATPNKYWLTDPHYRLPFLPWLPRRASQMYLKLVKGKDWDVFPISIPSLNNIFRNRFVNNYVTVDMIKNPKTYHLDTFSTIQPIVRRIPRSVLRSINILTPTIILVSKKK